jgi:septum formation protein
MAREKARAVRGNAQAGFILAADTVVAVGPQILGKPEDADDAKRMLRLLSDRPHEVITAVCLLGADFEDVRSESTAVHFAAMSDEDINDYVSSGEPMDKAGAYAIQGRASRWVSKIHGDFYNVVGLPIDLVWRMLGEHAVL